MLNLMSTVCWPPYKTGCYSNQERGTMNGCTAVIHKRIQVKNSCLDLPAMLFTPTSELKERMLKTGAQALFFVLSSAILKTYVYYRCKPVSRSPFPVPRSSFPDADFSTKPALSQVRFSSVLNSRSSLKTYAFTCVRFWGCYMNTKFRSMPNVKRLWPPWTSSHLHNIIVTHAKHFSLSDICPVGKEDGKMSSLSQLPFLLCSSVVVHRLIVNTATAVNVLISPFFVSCLFTQTDRLEQAMAFYTEE